MDQPVVTHADIKRPPLRGLGQIARFNWPQYVVGALCIVAAVAVVMSAELPSLLWWLFTIGIGFAAWWLVASLVASWWIYDRSRLTRWKWLREHLLDVGEYARLLNTESTPSPLGRGQGEGELLTDNLPSPQPSPEGRGGVARRLLNIHSGFDDTTRVLRDVFRDGALTVLDLFDADQMTEPSIRRARRAMPPLPGTLAARAEKLPVESASFDAALLLLAAHELRRPAEREALFSEVARALVPGGRLILAEHARDGWNFVAFGPGFFHFLPYAEWLRLAKAAGLGVVRAGRITPFIRYLVLEKS